MALSIGEKSTSQGRKSDTFPGCCFREIPGKKRKTRNLCNDMYSANENVLGLRICLCWIDSKWWPARWHLSLRMMQLSDQLKEGFRLVGQVGRGRLGVYCPRRAGEDIYCTCKSLFFFLLLFISSDSLFQLFSCSILHYLMNWLADEWLCSWESEFSLGWIKYISIYLCIYLWINKMNKLVNCLQVKAKSWTMDISRGHLIFMQCVWGKKKWCKAEVCDESWDCDRHGEDMECRPASRQRNKIEHMPTSGTLAQHL